MEDKKVKKYDNYVVVICLLSLYRCVMLAGQPLIFYISLNLQF